MAENESRRRRLTLGVITTAEANAFAANLELLRDHRKNANRLTPAIVEWINGLSRKHFGQLSSIGLVSSYDRTLTVGGVINLFLVAYKQRVVDREILQDTYDSAERKLRQFPGFFLRTSIERIEPTTDLEKPNAKPKFSSESKQTLLKTESHMREHYARATWSRTHKLLREVGNWAVGTGDISANPFVLLPSPGESDPSRNHEVQASDVLDAVLQCPCPDTSMMMILGRFAGLRLSSEARKLRWSDVCFDTPSITATGKKGVKRRIPMFEEVREALERQRKITGKCRFVIGVDYLKVSDSSHYNKILKAICRVTERYTRLRQNLRTSCENDWYEQGHPQRDVEQWIGHSRKVAKKHYDQDRDSRLSNAVERMK